MNTEGTVAYYALSLVGCKVRYIGRFSDDRAIANAAINNLPQVLDEVAMTETELGNLWRSASCAIAKAMLDAY